MHLYAVISTKPYKWYWEWNNSRFLHVSAPLFFFSLTWKTTWRTRTVWRRSGRRFVPTRQNPMPALSASRMATPRKTAQVLWWHVSHKPCLKPFSISDDQWVSLLDLKADLGTKTWFGRLFVGSCLSKIQIIRIHSKANVTNSNMMVLVSPTLDDTQPQPLLSETRSRCSEQKGCKWVFY